MVACHQTRQRKTISSPLKLWAKILSHYNRDVLKRLDEQGHLFKNNTNNNGKQRPASRHSVAGVGSVSAYAIAFTFFGEASYTPTVDVLDMILNL
jgi:hypothetical protein